ncbi:GntR family transcriptional regulator [Halodurantibacterium flavum]|uniref:GntR family transcriptional regulator n=1 Tax=Halodurantibacterium flavum TaxID=1382802 RepID=A0ABW4S0F7_9RHOB
MIPPTLPELREESDSQVDHAYERIEDLIVMLELAPGSRLVEATLAAQLGIGRTPIREALLRLAADGLLIWLPRRGMVVRDINFPLQMKVLETRRALESVLVPAAARRRSRAEAEAVERVVAHFRELLGTGQSQLLLRLDRRFIRLLVDLSRNPFLGQILPLYSLSRRFWVAHRDLYLRHYREETLTEFHIAIGEAVAEGDEAKAAERVGQFLDHVEEYTIYLGAQLSESEGK